MRAHRAAPLWLGLVLCWAGAAQAIHWVVCISNLPPMSTCTNTSSPATFSGFDVELFRRTAARVGWVETRNASQGADTWSFSCRLFSAMLEDLLSPTGTCALATGGITISSEREEQGLRFSFPSYHSSLAIMVHEQPGQANSWFFLKPFDWSVWLAIGLTVAAIPLITFVTEFISIEGRIQRRDVVPGLKEASWRSMWTMMLLEPFQVTAISSRVIAVIYGFLATVLVNTYCANLAAALTVSHLSTSIRGVDDLRGKAVGTTPVYVSRLAKYGVAASQLPFDGVHSALDDWVPRLRAGVLKATVVDEPLQQYVAALGGCDLQLVDSFAPFDVGLAFREGTNVSLIDDFDDRILALQEDGTASQLSNTFITIPHSGCDSNLTENTSITFTQVSGLWIILGAGLCLALLWLLGLRVLLALRRRRKARKAAAAASSFKRSSPAAAAAVSGSEQAHPRGTYKAGVAFRQTVSIFGAQIGDGRREAEAADKALEEGGGGGLKRVDSRLAANGCAASDLDDKAPPTTDAAVAQLLVQMRQLCDRIEAQGGGSYMDGRQRVVDDRIGEVPSQRE